MPSWLSSLEFGMHYEKGREELKRLCAIRAVYYQGTHVEEIKGAVKSIEKE